MDTNIIRPLLAFLAVVSVGISATGAVEARANAERDARIAEARTETVDHVAGYCELIVRDLPAEARAAAFGDCVDTASR